MMRVLLLLYNFIYPRHDNITHRDMKTENIICHVHNGRICRVVLADFGCSKMLP